MLEELKSIIKEACPEINVSEITEDTMLFSDLGIDSLRMVLVIIEIENHFGLNIDNFPSLKTVDDLANFVEELCKKKELNS